MVPPSTDCSHSTQHPAPILEQDQEEQGQSHHITLLAAPAKSHFYPLEVAQALKVFAGLEGIWRLGGQSGSAQLPPLALNKGLQKGEQQQKGRSKPVQAERTVATSQLCLSHYCPGSTAGKQILFPEHFLVLLFFSY